MVCEGEGALLPVALLGPKVTRLFTLLADWTREVFPVFKTEVGDLVDVLDTEEAKDPVAVLVHWFKEKSEIGARLQLCRFGPLADLKRSFLMSCKRASVVAPPLVFLSCFGLEVCSMGTMVCAPDGTSLQLLQFGAWGENCLVRGSNQ